MIVLYGVLSFVYNSLRREIADAIMTYVRKYKKSNAPKYTAFMKYRIARKEKRKGKGRKYERHVLPAPLSTRESVAAGGGGVGCTITYLKYACSKRERRNHSASLGSASSRQVSLLGQATKHVDVSATLAHVGQLGRGV